MNDKNKHTQEQDDAIFHHIAHIMAALENPGLSEEEIAAFLNVRTLAIEHYGSGPGKRSPGSYDFRTDAFVRELIVRRLYDVLPIAIARGFPSSRVARARHLQHPDVAYHLKRYQAGNTQPRETWCTSGPDEQLLRHPEPPEENSSS